MVKNKDKLIYLFLINLNFLVQPESKFSNDLEPICFDSKLDRKEVINCFTAGWGRTNGEKRLKEAKVKMVSPKTCLKYFSKNFQPKKQICGISQTKQRRRKGKLSI